jgi:hypothetical protein
MTTRESNDQVVRFEIPTRSAAGRLAELLEDGWSAWVHQSRGTHVVLATLDEDAEDLAILLRIVETWVDNESLWAIRYELDGRNYVLAAGDPVWGDLAAA